MKIKRKFLFGLITIILSTVLFVQAVPLELWKVAANGIGNREQTIDKYTDNISNDVEQMPDIVDVPMGEEAYIIKENIDKRRENVKEYLMSDGTIKVQQFAEAVHYLEDGEYKEIDNSLVEETDEKGQLVYTNRANSFKVKLQKFMNGDDQIVQINEDGYVLKFGYIREEENIIKSLQVGLNDIRKTFNYIGKKLTEPKEYLYNVGRVIYEKIKNGVDLEYEVTNKGIKENIVVNTFQNEYVYKFSIQTENLTLVMNDDGSIKAITSNNDTKFIIPAPFMTDHNKEYSTAVEYGLEEVVDGYILTVTADKNWIENAKLPVTIDPIVETYETSDFEFTNVYQDGTIINTGTNAYVGKKSGSNKSDLYVRFKVLMYGPQYKLVKAKLYYCHTTYGMGVFNWKTIRYTANLVDNNIALSDITYENRPSVVQFLTSNGADTNLASTTDSTTCYLNTSNIVSDELTIGFVCGNANSNSAYVKIYLSGSDMVSVTYTYEIISGIDEDYSMESFELNGAQAYVNRASGMLTANLDFASVNTDYLPLSISLVYNTEYNNIIDELGLQKSFGNNFKLNFQQELKYINNAYYYIDADGSVVSFVYDSNYAVHYTEDRTLCLRPNNSIHNIYDAEGNTLEFSDYKLYAVYNSEMPSRGAIKLTYVNNNQISAVSYYASYSSSTALYTISFTYSNNNVTVVTVKKGSTTLMNYLLTYDNEGNLTEIKNDSANITIFSMSYDTENRLSCLNDYTQNGYVFENETYSAKTENVYKIKVSTDEEQTVDRTYDFVSFLYGYAQTETRYYNENKLVTSHFVRFSHANHIISEWVEDEKGDVEIYAPGAFTATYNNSTWSDYTRESLAYKENINTSVKGNLSILAGATASGNITANSGVPVQDEYYMYMLSLKLASNSTTDITVTVTTDTGITTSRRIYTMIDGSVYFAVPCSYMSAGTYTIKNNHDTSTVTVSNISYTQVDYSKQIKTKPSTTQKAFYVKETTQYTRFGEYIYDTYDHYQRHITSEYKSTLKPEAETTTYEYYAPDGAITSMPYMIMTAHADYNTVLLYKYSGWNVSSITTNKGGTSMRKVYQTTGANESKVENETDENQVTTTKTYALLSGDIRLQKVESGGIYYIYEYDYMGNVTRVSKYDSSNVLLTSQTNNYQNGVYVGSTYAGQTYGVIYDDYGLVTDITHNEQNMITYTYSANKEFGVDANKLKTKQYLNGDVETYSYASGLTTSTITDADGNVEIYEYSTDDKNRVTSAIHKEGDSTVLSYNYGDLNSATVQSLAISGNLVYNVAYTNNIDDLKERVIGSTLSLTAGENVISYASTNSYDEEDRVYQQTFGDYNVTVYYDNFDRVIRYVQKKGSTVLQDLSYMYGHYYTDEIQYTNKYAVMTFNNGPTYYDYYTDGKLKSIGDNMETPTVTYNYDSYDRISSEVRGGVTTAYTYNANGLLSTAGTDTYGYDELGRLTTFNSSSNFVYDSMGNPTTYKGATLEWTQGRKLQGGTYNGNTFGYEYDTNGIRYKKTVGEVTTEYYVDGNRILAENRGGILIVYIYDLTGIAGMIYNNEYYTYKKNILGDIIKVINSAGTAVANYEYDAWGNIISKSGTMADINPFRYRGYYYDNETGFYYLQTRYYDPSIRMFINADNYELIGTLASITGQLNMYAYANNNPIMFTDENGEGIFFVLFLAAFTVVGAGVGLGVGISQGHEGWQLVGDIALGAAAGLFTGSLTASILGAYGVVAGKALILGMKPISTWALGSAIYDLLGFTIAPILRIDFVPIEYDGGKDYAIPDNMPPAIIRPYSTYVVGDYYG